MSTLNNPSSSLLSLAIMTTLITGLAASIITVQNQQRLNSQAAADKVYICHVPPGNFENAQAISISASAWENGHDPHASHLYDFIIDTENPNCPPAADSEVGE